ncbi:hypothetical protein EGW08_020613, partial [Elysia chlorotica]
IERLAHFEEVAVEVAVENLTRRHQAHDQSRRETAGHDVLACSVEPRDVCLCSQFAGHIRVEANGALVQTVHLTLRAREVMLVGHRGTHLHVHFL